MLHIPIFRGLYLLKPKCYPSFWWKIWNPKSTKSNPKPSSQYKGFLTPSGGEVQRIIFKPFHCICSILDLKSLNKYIHIPKFPIKVTKSVIASLSHSRCLFSYSHSHTSSALCSMKQTLPICHTSIWPILCTQCIHQGNCIPSCHFKNSSNRVPRQPCYERLVLFSTNCKCVRLIRYLTWFNFQKSALQPSLHLKYLGLILSTAQAKVFLLENKFISTKLHAQILRSKGSSGPHGDTLLFPTSLSSSAAKQRTPWFGGFPIQPWQWESPFFPSPWRVINDASLTGWGGVFQSLTVQGTWTPRESKPLITFLEIRVIKLALHHWTPPFFRDT